MPKRSIDYLKGLFVTGARPLQEWWHDIFDSFVHKDDIAAANESAINAKISAYDTALKAVNGDGAVNTLGDVFKVFENFNSSRNLDSQLKWANIPGRPTAPLAVEYSNRQWLYFSDMSIPLYDPNTGSTYGSSFRRFGPVVSTNTANPPVCILDLEFVRVNRNGFDWTIITGAWVGVNPRVVV